MIRWCCLSRACGITILLGSIQAYPGGAPGLISAALAAPAGPANSITLTNQSGAAIANYPLQFGRPFLDGAIPDEPQVLIGGAPAKTQADVKNRYPDGSVEYAVIAVLVPAIPASGSLTLTFQNQTASNNTPLTAAQMLGLSYMFSAQMILTSTAGGKAQSVDARTMLANGDYTLWTSGPVAQTIILADDTRARKYDIGFGDGYHPFRPRFVATFWPQTHQVWVRAIGENGLSTELEDLEYALTLTGANAKIYSNADLSHPAMATWTKQFWLGGTPKAQVNIDNNLAYLESTRFVPNYDPSLTPSQATIAYYYAVWWTDTNHDIGGSGAWTPGMPTTGARSDIGPEPSWDAVWLYTGDWRMRQTALGNADLAGAWPVNVRESDTTERLNRADPVPVAPAIGSGYGRPISITDRKYLGPAAGGEVDFLYYNSDDPYPPNQLDTVGPLNFNGAWAFDVAHEPSPFFVPYILTGDPFYLEELENWAAYDATTNNGAGAQGDFEGRGPTGDEGGAYDQLRGDGWVLRSRAEAAFAIPDADAFKTYLTILTQEDIARWEGGLGITGTVFDGSAEKVWAVETGDPESRISPTHQAPPLGNWEAAYDPGDDGGGQWIAGSMDGYTNQWMQWYVQYCVGRAAELGFAAGPLTLASGRYLIGIINSTGYPMLVAAYGMPTWFTSGPITSWSALVADLTPSYLTGVNWAGTSSQGPLPDFFNRQLYTQGYDAYVMAALAPLVDEGAPGASQAEAWVTANIYQPLAAGGQLASDPSWAIVPRTDTNALPPMPTTP
ncbi:MAG TPA: hypothetical protein VGM07_04535 [Stellaceae bacterium]|jgi:hypothetical protein